MSVIRNNTATTCLAVFKVTGEWLKNGRSQDGGVKMIGRNSSAGLTSLKIFIIIIIKDLFNCYFQDI